MNDWMNGLIEKCGFQRWIPSMDGEYDKSPSALALEPIEKVKNDDLGKWVMETCAYAEYARDDHYLNRNWETARNLYNGDGWHNEDKEEWRARIVSNFCAELIRSKAAYVTANNMTCYAYAVNAGDCSVSNFVRDIIQNIFYINDFNNKDQEITIDSRVCGTTYAKVYWDDELSYPFGDVGIKHCEPTRIITDWDIEDIQKGRFCGEVYYLSEARVKTNWKTKMHLIREGHTTEVQNSFDMNRKGDKYKVVEMFVVDGSTTKVIEIVEQQDPVTGAMMQFEQESIAPKYLNGRRIVVVEGIVVEDTPIGAELKKNHMRFPIIATKGIVQPHEQYGKSEIIEYEPIAREIIKRESHISDILNLYAHPVPVFAKGQFDNPAEQAVIGDDVYWEYNRRGNAPAPSLMTPDTGALSGAFQEAAMLKNDFRHLGGMPDAGRGVAPGSIQSGKGIRALQERSDVMNSPLLKQHGNFVTQIGKVAFAFVQYGYDTERIVRRVGPDGQMEHTEINKIAEDAQRVNDPTLGQFDISFDVSAAAPNNYAERSEEARNWAQVGLMDPITAITRSDLPNKEDAIRGAVAMSGNPLLAISAVAGGHLSQDDPVVQMILGRAQQEREMEQAQQQSEVAPGGASPSTTQSEQMG